MYCNSRFKIMHDTETDEYLYKRYECRHSSNGNSRWSKMINDKYKCYEEASKRMAMQIYTLMDNPDARQIIPPTL